MKKIMFLSGCLFIVFLTACTHQVKLDPNMDVTANIANKLNLKAGLYITPEIKNAVISDSADIHKYEYINFGQVLSSIINKAVNRVFTYVELLEAYPTQQMLTERNLDVCITARISEAKVALSFDEGFWSTEAQGTANLSLALTIFDKALLQIAGVQATGVGVGTDTLGAFSSGKDEFSIPVENALRNLGDNIVQQLYGNYDLRKMIEKK